MGKALLPPIVQQEFVGILCQDQNYSSFSAFWCICRWFSWTWRLHFYWVSIWLLWYRRWLTQDMNFLILILTSLLQKGAKIVNVLSFLHLWLVTEVLSGYAGWSGNTSKQLVEMFPLMIWQWSEFIAPRQRCCPGLVSLACRKRVDVFKDTIVQAPQASQFSFTQGMTFFLLWSHRKQYPNRSWWASNRFCPLRRGSGHLLLMLRFHFLLYRMIRRALKCPIVSSVNTRTWYVSEHCATCTTEDYELYSLWDTSTSSATSGDTAHLVWSSLPVDPSSEEEDVSTSGFADIAPITVDVLNGVVLSGCMWFSSSGHRQNFTAPTRNSSR